jgi:hypothetical protein
MPNESVEKVKHILPNQAHQAVISFEILIYT